MNKPSVFGWEDGPPPASVVLLTPTPRMDDILRARQLWPGATQCQWEMTHCLSMAPGPPFSDQHPRWMAHAIRVPDPGDLAWKPTDHSQPSGSSAVSPQTQISSRYSRQLAE